MGLRFEHKAVLVTGGASGIGRATAEAFAREGAMVMVADRDQAAAEIVSAQLRAQGATVDWVEVDVQDPASCDRMVAHMMSSFGALHIAFNNAAVPSKHYVEFDEITTADWDQTLAVNLNGVFYAMKAEVVAMRISGGGAIINTGSMMSAKTAPGMAAYITSKHGVAGLTQAAALDLIRHGIRVNAVCPGFVDTAMLAPVLAKDGARAALESSIPIGRIASPEEIANAVLFLASEEASYFVGATLHADGASTIV